MAHVCDGGWRWGWPQGLTQLGVHASNGGGVVEDGELEGQPALDAAAEKEGRSVSEHWLVVCSPGRPLDSLGPRG